MHTHDDDTELPTLAADTLFERAFTSKDEEREWSAIQRLYGLATKKSLQRLHSSATAISSRASDWRRCDCAVGAPTASFP